MIQTDRRTLQKAASDQCLIYFGLIHQFLYTSAGTKSNLFQLLEVW